MVSCVQICPRCHFWYFDVSLRIYEYWFGCLFPWKLSKILKLALQESPSESNFVDNIVVVKFFLAEVSYKGGDASLEWWSEVELCVSVHNVGLTNCFATRTTPAATLRRHRQFAAFLTWLNDSRWCLQLPFTASTATARWGLEFDFVNRARLIYLRSEICVTNGV